jgi:hypothetical protein
MFCPNFKGVYTKYFHPKGREHDMRIGYIAAPESLIPVS